MKFKIVRPLAAISFTLLFTACTTVESPKISDVPKETAIPKQEIPLPAVVKTEPERPTVKQDKITKDEITPDKVTKKELEQKDLSQESTEPDLAEKELEPEEAPETSTRDETPQNKEPSKDQNFPNPVANLCREIGTKLGSVSIDECLAQQLSHSSYSTENRSLAYKDFLPLEGRKPMGRILVIGGIHGDEFSSVSMLFRWMGILNQYHSGMFHWRFVPSSNPDGLLQKKSQRQNYNGVDLNRNFPTLDWENQALSYWEQDSLKSPRRYPGPSAASETETKWLVSQIQEFEPDVIISMHAPYHLVDYDGPPKAPNNLGSLYLRKLGVYPGSLGNYAGIDLNMPIVTVELQSAGIMPNKQEINTIWGDLVTWLQGQLTPAD
ncbi:MAG: protein MpaA [Candidatus Azotimanducaceae bacterium]|jgi:protein MpaA